MVATLMAATSLCLQVSMAEGCVPTAAGCVVDKTNELGHWPLVNVWPLVTLHSDVARQGSQAIVHTAPGRAAADTKATQKGICAWGPPNWSHQHTGPLGLVPRWPKAPGFP